MPPRTLRLLAGSALFALACDSSSAGPGAEPPTWVVDSTPTLALGTQQRDTADYFAGVFGATRLPDGNILVGDRQQFALHMYAPTGERLRTFGRLGSGPGELEFPVRFWRCGDLVYVQDRGSDRRVSVFSAEGEYQRVFTHGGDSRQGGRSPYRSVCNDAGTFAHYGWESAADISPDRPVYRPRVPLWITSGDSVVRILPDSFPGAERVLQLNARGEAAGSGPRIFGRDTPIALGSDRLYIGTAERADVLSLRLADTVMDTIRLPFTTAPLTAEHIAAERAVRIAASPPDRLAFTERMLNIHPFPDSLPPYTDLRLDDSGLLWVRRNPAPGGTSVPWWVIADDGRAVAQVSVPSFLDVFEIGRDYILGRYLHPDEAVPQVHLYRLRR
jgi:hypothetical protein